MALAKKLGDPATGRFGLAYQYADFYYHAALMNAFGGGVFKDGNQPVVNQPANVKSLDFLLGWIDRDKILPLEPSTALITSLFNSGKAAIVFSGPWFLGEIASTVDWGLAPLPTIDEAGGQPMRPWMTVEGVYIAAPSKNKDAAYEFAKYLTDVAAGQGPGARRAPDAGQPPGLRRRQGRRRSGAQGVPARRSRWRCRCPTCPR